MIPQYLVNKTKQHTLIESSNLEKFLGSSVATWVITIHLVQWLGLDFELKVGDKVRIFGFYNNEQKNKNEHKRHEVLSMCRHDKPKPKNQGTAEWWATQGAAAGLWCMCETLWTAHVAPSKRVLPAVPVRSWELFSNIYDEFAMSRKRDWVGQRGWGTLAVLQQSTHTLPARHAVMTAPCTCTTSRTSPDAPSKIQARPVMFQIMEEEQQSWQGTAIATHLVPLARCLQCISLLRARALHLPARTFPFFARLSACLSGQTWSEDCFYYYS